MVNYRQNRVENLLKPARGQALVEYALILVLLAMALSFAVAATGPAIGNVFCNVVDNIAGEQSSDICGRSANPLSVEGGSPNLFWATVTWVAANPQGETPFPTPIKQPPTSGASVYNSPTPSQTPTETHTATNTFTPTITPTVTIGPSPTPSDLEFEVPHVDQIARPEWWRLGSGYWLGDGGESWSATYYDDAGTGTVSCTAASGGFAGTLATPPRLCNPRNTLIYGTSDLSFDWGNGSGGTEGRPADAGLTASTDNNTWGAVFTRTLTISGTAQSVLFTLTANDYLRLSIDGTPIVYTSLGTVTSTQTLAVGSHTITLHYAENTNNANFSFTAQRTTVNASDSTSGCPWGQATNANNSNSATFQFENKASGSFPAGATCHLELRGWVDIAGVTNPVLSFWDVWDFVGATATADLQVGEYNPVLGSISWTSVSLHSGGSANYNWTRYEVPIGSYGGTSNQVTFRFRLTGNAASNFRWHIDDIQILSESLSPGTFTVGNTWDLNSRSQMNDFIYNSDSSKTIKDNPSLPDTTSTWRWDLTSNNARSGTAWDDSPSYTYLDNNSSGIAGTTYRESYLEFKKLIDLSTAPATDTESDTGRAQLSFWMAYDIAVNTGRLQVEYTRDARDTTVDTWTAVPNGGLLLNYTAPVGVPGPNEQTPRTNLVMQYIEVSLENIPNWNTQPFRLRFALSVNNATTPSGQGWYIDDIAIDRQNASPYLAYPFYDDAQTTTNLTSYWQNIGGSWGFTSERPTQGATDTYNEVSPGALNTSQTYSDSPNASYDSSVTRSLEMRFPLDLLNDSPLNLTDPSGRAAASEPILSFWHHRDVGTGSSLRFSVELWTPAISTWREVWYYDPASGDPFAEQDAWERIEINLRHALEAASSSTWAAIVASPATDDDDVKIRFKFVTDSTGGKDGIYVDEISITNANYPVFKVWPTGSGGNGIYADHVESLEQGATGVGTVWSDRWYTGGIWDATSTSTHTGALGFDIAPNAAQYMYNSYQILELAPIIDLTSTPLTEATFLYWWMLYDIGNSNHTLKVQIAQENAAEASLLTNQFYGKMGDWTAWTDVPYSVDSVSNTSIVGERTIGTWQRAQVNLNAYRTYRIRIRFVLQVADSSNDREIYFDDFTIFHGPRNLTVPFSDTASSMTNWVGEGSWGLTNEYFIDTGEVAAGLGSNQWVGWFYDCESLGGSDCTDSDPSSMLTLLNTTYPTNPTSPTCAGTPNLIATAPVGPECASAIDFFYGLTGTPMGGAAPNQFQDSWGARWTRSVSLSTGTYIVRIINRRGVRLWIDDTTGTNIAPYLGGPRGLIVNQFTAPFGTSSNFATFTVTGSLSRTLTVEWFATTNESTLQVAISKGSYSFSDSPNTPNGGGWTQVNSTEQGNSSLISNGYFNFTGLTNPQLGYQMLYRMGSNMTFTTEISNNGGLSWSIVDTINPYSTRILTSGWEQRSANLTAYGNQANVMVRFRMDATGADDPSYVDDGVWISDIRVTP